MFITNEDYNFLSYNILILLDVLKSDSEATAFIDYKKLAFLIDFVSNRSLIDLINKNNYGKISAMDKEYLTKVYTSCYVRQIQLAKLMFFLEKQNLINLGTSTRSNTVNIWLNRDKLNEFYDKELFLNEYRNTVSLKTIVGRLRTLSLSTLKDKLFYRNGVKKWEV